MRKGGPPHRRVAVPVGVGGLAALLLVTPLPKSQGVRPAKPRRRRHPGPPPSFAAATVPLTQQFGTPQHPLRVLLIGDSIAWSMGRGMDLYAAGDQRFVFTNQGIKGCGIARGGMTSCWADVPNPTGA